MPRDKDKEREYGYRGDFTKLSRNKELDSSSSSSLGGSLHVIDPSDKICLHGLESHYFT